MTSCINASVRIVTKIPEGGTSAYILHLSATNYQKNAYMPRDATSTEPEKLCAKFSVADPGCLSRIPDPDFYPSRIPDLGYRIPKQHQKRGVKKIFCHSFFCSHKFHKIDNYFSFEMLKKRIWCNFQRII